MKIRLNNVRIAFPALGKPQVFGEGEPAYGARFIIIPKSDNAKLLTKTVAEVAATEWKDKSTGVLKKLGADRRVCYTESAYLTKEGEPYDGFAGNHYVQTRNAKGRPTIFNQYGEQIEDAAKIEALIYGGCFTHAMIDLWAQDNKWGQRINATLLGVMFAGEGASFGGGAPPAAADDFAGLAAERSDLEGLV